MNTKEQPETQNTLNSFLKESVAQQWFGLLILLVYGSGFLCEYTFLDRFGIQESGQDFFRVKFIHVGILFLLFPISILIPAVLKISLKNSELKATRQESTAKLADVESQQPTDSTKRFKFPISTMASFFNISAVFYFFVFTPRNFVYKRGFLIPVIIGLSFLGPLVTDSLVSIFIVPRFKGTLSVFLRWLLLVCGIGSLDYWVFKDFREQLWYVFWGDHWVPDGGIYYLAFMILIPYTLWRNNAHVQKVKSPRYKTELRLIGVSLSLMFLFLGIVTFALRLYPLIPVAKGGGNYCENPVVCLTFSEKGNGLKTNDVMFLKLTLSNCFTIIERTPTSLFLADTNEAGGPHEWQKMVLLPHIVEVRNDSIDRIAYTQVVESNIYSNP